jgi:hypothetical protein
MTGQPDLFPPDLPSKGTLCVTFPNTLMKLHFGKQQLSYLSQVMGYGFQYSKVTKQKLGDGARFQPQNHGAVE